MRWTRIIGVAAIVFGALTLVSGSMVLWGPGGVRAAAGDVIVPILWFNTLSGAFYVIAGAGILSQRGWATGLAWALVAAILVMLIVLAVLIAAGHPWEPRTLVAMVVRLVFWLAAARIAAAHLRRET